MEQRVIKVPSSEDTAAIFGSYDTNVRAVEQTFGVQIRNRAADDGGDCIIVTGPDREQVNKGAAVIEYLADMIKYSQLSEQSVRYVIDMVDSGKGRELAELGDDCICVTTKGKPIKAKTVGQSRYVDAIRKNTIVLGVGPAGTGKTFLAVAMAV